MDLMTIIDAYVAERQAHDTAERSQVDKFRMSDAGKCRLMRYWKRQGKPASAPISPEALRQMQAGLILHDFLGQVIAAHFLTNGATRLEGELQDEHRIGHYDVWVQTVNGSILYDLKTVKGKEANYLEKYGKEAKRQHQYQIVSYASLLDPRPDELRVAYIDRETLRVVQEYQVCFNLLIQEVHADWDILIGAWNAQVEPDANPDDTWECKFCAYRDSCPSCVK